MDRLEKMDFGANGEVLFEESDAQFLYAVLLWLTDGKEIGHAVKSFSKKRPIGGILTYPPKTGPKDELE
jgi:hypothetical protein